MSLRAPFHSEKAPYEIVCWARLIYQRGGYTPKEVQQHLKEKGHSYSYHTIVGWLKFRNRITA